MCDPVSATLAIISATTTGVGIISQNKANKQTRQMLEAQAANEQEDTLDRNEEDLGERIRAMREQRARVRVAAGESGALGASFAASINQSLQDQDAQAALTAKNVTLANRATNDKLTGELSRIRDISGLEAGLQIGQSAVQGYSMGKALGKGGKKPKKTKTRLNTGSNYDPLATTGYA